MLDRLLSLRATATTKPSSGYFYHPRASAGINVDEDTALTYSAVFSAVKVISETVALLPWRVYSQAGERRELLAGEHLDVLLHRAPNQEQTAFAFREFLLASALLHGNGYAEIERTSSGEPVGLYTLHPSAVTPERDAVNRLVYRVRQESGGDVVIPARQMLHLRGPTKDGIVGRSVISLAKESWGLGIAAEQFAGAFFGNGAVPSLFIEQGDAAPALSKEGATNMLESFERRHKGAGKAGKAAYLEKGFTVKTIGIPQKDAQFLETRKHGVTDVARWFRIPPHKIGDMERSTFSNIESQERNFVNDAILPWATRLEQEADAKLLDDSSRASRFTKLDARALLRGDSTQRGEYYTKMRDLGVFSINDILGLEDMNPIDGGELRLVPLNMVSLERAAQSGGTDPASAMRGVLLDAHDRMLSKEARAMERARDSAKDMHAWAVDFFSRHEPQMRDALMPGAMAIGAMHDTDAATISGVIDSHVRLHCEASIAAAVAGIATNHNAAAETDRLLGRIVGASHGR